MKYTLGSVVRDPQAEGQNKPRQVYPHVASLSVYLENAHETGTEGGPIVPFRQLCLILAGKQAAAGI